MSRVSPGPRNGSLSPFELHALTALPCGCVIGGFRARTIDVELVSVEARGPHCDLQHHRVGQVLGLGERGELDALMVGQTAA